LNQDGSERWEIQTAASVEASPVIGPDGTVYFTNANDSLFAVFGENGGLADSYWPMVQQNPRHTSSADSLVISNREACQYQKEFVAITVIPNPFSLNTAIEVIIPTQTGLKLKIYNANGVVVINRYFADVAEGIFRFVWNGKDDSNTDLPDGIYYCTISTDTRILDTKIILMNY